MWQGKTSVIIDFMEWTFEPKVFDGVDENAALNSSL
jgi:hypothetical protein